MIVSVWLHAPVLVVQVVEVAIDQGASGVHCFTPNLPACMAARACCFLVQVVEVAIDASEVPSDYILAILSQCSTFPEVRSGLGALHVPRCTLRLPCATCEACPEW